MYIISDILIGLSSLVLALYCLILGRRLKKFKSMEHGIGEAVKTLSDQVTEMTSTLKQTKAASTRSAHDLSETTQRAENVARRLELLIASMHDIPEENSQPDSTNNSPIAQKSTPTFLRAQPENTRRNTSA